MLWLRVLPKLVEPVWGTRRKDIFAGLPRQTADVSEQTSFDKYLEVDLCLHSPPWAEILLEPFTRQYWKKENWKEILTRTGSNAVKIIAFLFFFFVPFVISLAILAKTALDKVWGVTRLDVLSSGLQSPLSGWITTALTITAVLALFVFTGIRKRLSTINIRFLLADEPLPMVKRVPPHSYTIAVRLLHPNLVERTRRYLGNKKAQIIGWDAMRRERKKPFRLPPSQQSRLRLEQDICQIARLGLWLVLSPTTTGDSSRFSITQSTASRVSRSVYFAYKFHLPQIRAYLLLWYLGLAVPIAKPFGPHVQYPLILAGIALIWAYWSIRLHRREMNSMVDWQLRWASKPFASSPIFLLDYGDNRHPHWVELIDDNFTTLIREYGLEKEQLLNLLLGIFLVAFITMLHLAK